jgi:hypothetical protein
LSIELPEKPLAARGRYLFLLKSSIPFIVSVKVLARSVWSVMLPSICPQLVEAPEPTVLYVPSLAKNCVPSPVVLIRAAFANLDTVSSVKLIVQSGLEEPSNVNVEVDICADCWSM